MPSRFKVPPLKPAHQILQSNQSTPREIPLKSKKGGGSLKKKKTSRRHIHMQPKFKGGVPEWEIPLDESENSDGPCNGGKGEKKVSWAIPRAVAPV